VSTIARLVLLTSSLASLASPAGAQSLLNVWTTSYGGDDALASIERSIHDAIRESSVLDEAESAAASDVALNVTSIGADCGTSAVMFLAIMPGLGGSIHSASGFAATSEEPDAIARKALGTVTALAETVMKRASTKLVAAKDTVWAGVVSDPSEEADTIVESFTAFARETSNWRRVARADVAQNATYIGLGPETCGAGRPMSFFHVMKRPSTAILEVNAGSGTVRPGRESVIGKTLFRSLLETVVAALDRAIEGERNNAFRLRVEQWKMRKRNR
jgi:hypothetical protein